MREQLITPLDSADIAKKMAGRGNRLAKRIGKGKAPDHSDNKPLTFPTQRPNEHVVLLLRRHWTVLAHHIVQLVASLIIPPVVLLLIYTYTSISVQPGTALYVISIEALSLFYLFSFLAYFHDFIDYHLDIWVVTDQRVVSIEQEGLFNRVVSELNILRVQDVTSEIKGKVQTFLDYGQVHIQTAGEEARFVFEQVPHPSQVAKVILQVHDRANKLNDLEKVQTSETYRQQMRAGQAPQQPGQPGQPGGIVQPASGQMTASNAQPIAGPAAPASAATPSPRTQPMTQSQQTPGPAPGTPDIRQVQQPAPHGGSPRPPASPGQ